jgi:hypothetical protein
MSFQGNKDRCFPHQEEIAERAYLCRREIVRALKHLSSLSLVRKRRRGRGLTNIYECLAPFDVSIGEIEKCQLRSLQEVTNAVTQEVTTDVTSILKDHLKDQKTQERAPAVEAADAKPIRYTGDTPW